ncbi:hypothetical protein K3495_g321 [Podosphaera aphanis]|nr:hypothetical protein K3495_g321 [Podosphaera aphanis]
MRKTRSSTTRSHSKPKTTEPPPSFAEPSSSIIATSTTPSPSSLSTSVSIPEKHSVSPSRLPIKLSRNSSDRSANTVTNTVRPRSACPSASNREATAESETTKSRVNQSLTAFHHLRNPSASSAAAKARESYNSRDRISTITASASSRLTTRGSVDAPKAQLLSSELQHQLKKPSFSTHQQHFSPAKNLAPKPHPATFLAPPTPSKWPSNKAITAEIAKLQNELLQLHILHQDNLQTSKEWHTSARKKLECKFYDVAVKNQHLEQLEKQENSQLNAVALKRWQDTGVPGWTLEEKIQVLDQLLADFWNVYEPGGKYARVLKRFDGWVTQCQPICDSWTQGFDEAEDEVQFIKELESTWKDDCLILGRKIQTWIDNLRDIGVTDSRSSLGMLIVKLQRIVRGMRTELNLMMQIEEDVMETELQWIKRMIGDTNDDSDALVVGAIWRNHQMTHDKNE